LFTEPNSVNCFAEHLIASSLLDYIYELTDIREIESRIPELAGLCDYLKTLAPDEYHAYCKLGDQIKYNAPLDINGYCNFIKEIKMELGSEISKET